MSEHEVDSRGIRRGRCTECGCVSYSGGEKRMKCTNIGCGHPPGKHHNLASSQLPGTTTSAVGTTPQTSTSPTYHSGGPYPSHGHHSDPYSQPYTHSYHYYPQPPAHRPRCGADGCTSLVHWEPDVGSFDYCSPECRNKHLLPIQKDQLLSDLTELTELLHTAAMADATDESKHVSASATGKGLQQKTVCVLLEKTAGRDPGFIFHETRYNNCGLLITGVAVCSAAYKLMQNDKIRFLDVIEKLNDQPVSSLQKSFAGVALELPLIRMLVKRPISLPPTSKLISDIMKFNSSIPPTHILVLRSTYTLKDSDEFGLTFSMHSGEGLRVTGISKERPARQCGLRFDDVIQLFAVATMKTVGGLHSCLQTSDFFEKSLSDAATNGWSLILAIRRRLGTLI